jgi:hypothetical protein
MNCPRCTRELPEDSRFCPACGLDLESVSEEASAAQGPPEADDAVAEPETEATPAAGSLWPQWLAIQSARTPKKPALAATFAFLFGPFTYLYLEQAAWFWWGLLGGIILCILSRGDLVFVLHIGGILHAWDVARMLNERLDHEPFEALPAATLEEEGA